MVGEWRVSDLNLPRRPQQRLRPRATLYAYSPHVLPAPTDWPNEVAVTGYWFLNGEEDWQPNPELKSFIEGGEAPVYVGFGSMPGIDPLSMTKLVLEALSKACSSQGVACRATKLSYPDRALVVSVAAILTG